MGDYEDAKEYMAMMVELLEYYRAISIEVLVFAAQIQTFMKDDGLVDDDGSATEKEDPDQIRDAAFRVQEEIVRMGGFSGEIDKQLPEVKLWCQDRWMSQQCPTDNFPPQRWE